MTAGRRTPDNDPLPPAQEDDPPMFRFTIRDVLWLTVVVALAVGWWIEHRSQTAKVEALDKEVRHLRQQPWMTDYGLGGRIDRIISSERAAD